MADNSSLQRAEATSTLPSFFANTRNSALEELFELGGDLEDEDGGLLEEEEEEGNNEVPF